MPLGQGYLSWILVRGRGGEVPEWPKGADCKSAADRLRRFESSPLHHHAGIAQLAEREPSKLGVAGSNPVSRSIFADGR